MRDHSTLPDLATIRARAASHVPVTHPADRPWQAATAMVLAPGATGPDLAFIRRATRRGDRFSGDMALPGGVRDPHDPDLAATAARETYEEVGLQLPAPVGRLDDHHGRTRRGLVATYVYVLDDRPPLQADPTEVAEALWIPLGWLSDPASATSKRWAGIRFPAVQYEGRVIWGLTHQMLTRLSAAVAVPIGGVQHGAIAAETDLGG